MRPSQEEIRLAAHWTQTPDGRPYFEIYCDFDMAVATKAERRALHMAMQAGLVRWILDKARIWPTIIE